MSLIMSDIAVTINGSQLTGRDGMTILEVAQASGIDIPTLCYRPELSPIGACRICVVEVEGSRTLVGACHTPIAEGMVVHLSGNSGIVGGGYKTLLPETVALMSGNLVILSADEVKECLDISGYDDALRSDLQRLAEKIIEDWRRMTDDAAILIFRNKIG